MRWPMGVRCTSCDSSNVAKRGFDESQKERYRCSDCEREFDDLTGTIFAGHHIVAGYKGNPEAVKKKNENGVGGV